MDNHPIPQDVTGFQFRLIGNMTVKQFAYVAVGAVGAVIIFYLPIFAVLKIILIPVFIIAGVGLAFLPIEGRPVDVMVTHFLKALFSPNQFLYHKEGGHLMLSTVHIDQKAVNQAQARADKNSPAAATQEQRQAARRQQLSSYLTTIHQNQATDEKEAGRISALFENNTAAPALLQPITDPTPPAQQIVQTQVAQPTVTQAAPQLPELQPIPTQPQTPVPSEHTATETTPIVAPDADTVIQMQKDTEKIAEDETLIQKMNAELTRAKAAEQEPSGATNQTAHVKVTEMEQKLNELMQAKQQLEEELRSLKTAQTKKIVTTPVIPSVPVAPAAPEKAVTKTSPVSPVTQPASGFPSLPDFPNILLGVVRDSSGNVLPHILVDVKDAEDNPIRAFKTNQLGQFISATPLKEGTYTIHLEDAKNQYKFDVYTVTVNNTILPPLQIDAHDLREELRKSLFA